jgi:hypothetical protein
MKIIVFNFPCFIDFIGFSREKKSLFLITKTPGFQGPATTTTPFSPSENGLHRLAAFDLLIYQEENGWIFHRLLIMVNNGGYG